MTTTRSCPLINHTASYHRHHGAKPRIKRDQIGPRPHCDSSPIPEPEEPRRDLTRHPHRRFYRNTGPTDHVAHGLEQTKVATGERPITATCLPRPTRRRPEEGARPIH